MRAELCPRWRKCSAARPAASPDCCTAPARKAVSGATSPAGGRAMTEIPARPVQVGDARNCAPMTAASPNPVADRPKAPSLRVGGGLNIEPATRRNDPALAGSIGPTGWQAGASASHAARRVGGASPIAAPTLRPAAIVGQRVSCRVSSRNFPPALTSRGAFSLAMCKPPIRVASICRAFRVGARRVKVLIYGDAYAIESDEHRAAEARARIREMENQ